MNKLPGVRYIAVYAEWQFATCPLAVESPLAHPPSMLRREVTGSIPVAEVREPLQRQSIAEGHDASRTFEWRHEPGAGARFQTKSSCGSGL